MSQDDCDSRNGAMYLILIFDAKENFSFDQPNNEGWAKGFPFSFQGTFFESFEE